MYYPELNTELKSSFAKEKKFTATMTNDTRLPDSGLNARELLDKKQLSKVIKMRDKKLKLAAQKENFIKD